MDVKSQPLPQNHLLSFNGFKLSFICLMTTRKHGENYKGIIRLTSWLMPILQHLHPWATLGATKPYMMIKHPMINPTHALRLEKHLATPTASKARYVLDNIIMRDYTIHDGVATHHFTDVVPPGPMPKRIVMMLQP